MSKGSSFGNHANHAVRPIIHMVASDEADVVERIESWDDLKDAPFGIEESDIPLCGNGDDDEVVQDADGDAYQCPRALPEPKCPSRAAMLRHNLTHWPYASWCPHCVMGRAVSYGHHAKVEDKEDRVPLVCADCMYMHEDKENKDRRRKRRTGCRSW